jgi:peptidoglycan/LPS O-acetylase OafA/YrhL
MRGSQARWRAIGDFSKWVAIVGTPALLVSYGAGVCSYDRPATMIYGYTPVALVCGAWLRLALMPDELPRVAATLANSTLRFFGKYSYSIYLINLPMRAVIRDTIFSRPITHTILGSGLPYQFAFYIAATATLVPLALLSWKVLEAPLLSLKRFFPR